MIKYLLFILIILNLIFADAGNITVDITGIRNNKGVIGYLLFNSKEGWPDNTKKAIKRGTANITEKTARFEIKSIPYGEYALSVLHDENMNKKTDYSFLGFPLEGFGTSNNNYRKYGAPLFKKATTKISTQNKNIKIEMQYY